jgi:mono/diheme cytochrome c family protein
MKKLFRFLVITIGVTVGVAAAAAAFVYVRGVPTYESEKSNFVHISSPASIERGRKLSSMLCANCHLDDQTGKLSGKRMLDAPPEFGIANSANITRDEEFGIGNYTDGELVVLLRTGVKRNGQYAPPYMAKLPHLSDEDMNAIISFLRSDDPWVQAVHTPAPPCEPSLLTKFLCNTAFKPLPMPKQSIASPDTSNRVELGRYLAHNLDCYACHSGDFTKMDILRPENSFRYFGGGNLPLNFEGKPVMTSNITPDKETGIGLWSEDTFVRALKYGILDGQDALRYPMVPYVQLSDYEAGAIYAYLMTIPPIHNSIPRN